MDYKEFLKGINKIELAYNTKFNNEKLIFWYSKLKHMDPNQYLERIDKLISTNNYIPNIAEIIGQTSRAFADYEQRELTNIDFDSLYANKQYKEEIRK